LMCVYSLLNCVCCPVLCGFPTLQFYNPASQQHLVSFAGQGQRHINLGTVKWEKVDKKPPPHQQQHKKPPQQHADKGAAAAAGAGHQAHKPHAAAHREHGGAPAAAAAGPAVNPSAVSTEPPPEGMVCPTPNITSLIRQRIRVWWPDDKAWYAGEVTVSHATLCCTCQQHVCVRAMQRSTILLVCLHWAVQGNEPKLARRL